VIADPGDWLTDILEEHASELPFLWSQRTAAWRAPGFSVRALGQLDERLDAHTDALALAREEALSFLLPLVESGDPYEVHSATYALLRMGLERVERDVIELFGELAEDAVQGFARAFAYTRVELRRAPTPSPQHEAVVLRALAYRGELDDVQRLGALLHHGEPEVRRNAWLALAFIGARGNVDWRDVLAGAMEDEPELRRLALRTFAWSRQKWLLGELRRVVDGRSPGRPEALELLAVLGTKEDASRIQEAVEDTSLGPERFLWVGRLGNPKLVELLFSAMESEDIVAAACAATAFRTMTGVLVESGRFHELDDGQLPIPDAALARARWREMERSFERATRLCHGVEVGQGLPKEALPLFDLPSLADGRLRDFFHKRWEGGPVVMEDFPYRG
jgi:uncharacterized protein (TIGR02270 family)